MAIPNSYALSRPVPLPSRYGDEKVPNRLGWISKVSGIHPESFVSAPKALIARRSAGVSADEDFPSGCQSSAEADGPRRIGSGFQPDPAPGFPTCPAVVRAIKAFGAGQRWNQREPPHRKRGDSGIAPRGRRGYARCRGSGSYPGEAPCPGTTHP